MKSTKKCGGTNIVKIKGYKTSYGNAILTGAAAFSLVSV